MPLPLIESEVRRRRTFAIISHPDAGKTTLTEKLLLFGGAIQLAGAEALSTPSITKRTVEKYSRRHNLLVKTLSEVGFQVSKPKGSFYLYTQAPKGIEGGETFNTAEDFSQWLIREKQISTVPWDDAGHFIRFSVTFMADTEAEEVALMEEIKRRLSGSKFIW